VSKNSSSRPAEVRNHSTMEQEEQQVKAGRIRMMTVLRTTVRARLCGGL
jgi:hypothetical protein